MQIFELKSLFGSFGFVLLFFFLLAPVVLLLEFLNSTSRVNKFHFASVERVRGRADFDLEQRILFAVFFPGAGFFALDRRFDQESCTVGSVLEDHIPVFRVDVLLHCLTFQQLPAGGKYTSTRALPSLSKCVKFEVAKSKAD